MINTDETITELIANNPEMINIIQITDTHILDDGAPSFNDYDTSASLKKVVAQIKDVEADTDLILLTGDLVHEPTETAYQKLADHLSVLTIPILCLPGNHDDAGRMSYIMGANGYDTGRLIRTGQWLVILLDTSLEDASGELSPSELEFLQASLESNPDLHCLIALHHHPVAINSTWMDAMALNNAEAFLKVVDHYDHIRAIIWGHVHQEFELIRNNVKLLATPSTCLQFVPGSDVFAVDEKPPAYRKLTLKPDGSVHTEVIYLGKSKDI